MKSEERKLSAYAEKLQRKRKRAKNDAATAIRCLIQWADERKAWGTLESLEEAFENVADAFAFLQADEELQSGAFEGGEE